MSLGKLFFGILVLLVGIMFLLDTLDIVPGAWRLWPIIIIAAAIFIIIGAFVRPRVPWYKTEEGWQKFAEKMEKKFGDQKKWEKFGKKMGRAGEETVEEFEDVSTKDKVS